MRHRKSGCGPFVLGMVFLPTLRLALGMIVLAVAALLVYLLADLFELALRWTLAFLVGALMVAIPPGIAFAAFWDSIVERRREKSEGEGPSVEEESRSAEEPVPLFFLLPGVIMFIGLAAYLPVLLGAFLPVAAMLFFLAARGAFWEGWSLGLLLLYWAGISLLGLMSLQRQTNPLQGAELREHRKSLRQWHGFATTLLLISLVSIPFHRFLNPLIATVLVILWFFLSCYLAFPIEQADVITGASAAISNLVFLAVLVMILAVFCRVWILGAAANQLLNSQFGTDLQSLGTDVLPVYRDLESLGTEISSVFGWNPLFFLREP